MRALPSSAWITSPKAKAGVATIEGAQKLYGMAKDYYQKHLVYTVTVTEGDPLYSEIHSWLFLSLPDGRHRAVTVHTAPPNRMSDLEAPSSEYGDIPPKKLTLRFSENTTRVISIEGYPVRISLQTPEASSDSNFGRHTPTKIHFQTYSHGGQKAVLRKLEEINANRAGLRKPVLKLVTSWGSWRTRGDLPLRTMESVALPQEQKKRIVQDLRSFLDQENQYNRLAIPWHRGYMFHGPPGTGKTSLAKALANEFNLDIWYISLSDLKAESSLLGLLSEVSPRSILLLEDIDTIKITHDRDSSDPGTISMSSLLNTLDGVATPHGLISIMTTNRFELLDPALTRAGRMDLIEKIDYPTVRTLESMFFHFYGYYPDWPVKNLDDILEGVSTSQVTEIMKNHMYDPDKATVDILSILVTLRTN